MVAEVSQHDFAGNSLWPERTQSAADRPQRAQSIGLNQGEYVLQLVRDAAESYTQSQGVLEVPREGVPGENLDVTA